MSEKLKASCCTSTLENLKFQSRIEGFVNSVDRKLKLMSSEISTEFKELKATLILVYEDTISDLKMEKLEVSNKNEKLIKENKDLCQTISECRSKLLDLQDEKTSLLTALKLTQRDNKEELEIYKNRIEALETENKNLREEIHGFKKMTRRKYKTPSTTDPQQTNNMLKEKNQFGVLSSEDDTEDCKMDSKPKSCISICEDTPPDCEIISSQSNLSLNNQSTHDTSINSETRLLNRYNQEKFPVRELLNALILVKRQMR